MASTGCSRSPRKSRAGAAACCPPHGRAGPGRCLPPLRRRPRPAWARSVWSLPWLHLRGEKRLSRDRGNRLPSPNCRPGRPRPTASATNGQAPHTAALPGSGRASLPAAAGPAGQCRRRDACDRPRRRHKALSGVAWGCSCQGTRVGRRFAPAPGALLSTAGPATAPLKEVLLYCDSDGISAHLGTCLESVCSPTARQALQSHLPKHRLKNRNVPGLRRCSPVPQCCSVMVVSHKNYPNKN